MVKICKNWPDDARLGAAIYSGFVEEFFDDKASLFEEDVG